MEKGKKKHFSALLIIFLFLGTNFASNKNQKEKSGQGFERNGQITTENFEIAEHLVFCEEIVPRKCLQYRKPGEAKFRPLWDEIENFKFIGGYRYLLSIEVEKIKNPPKDTSGKKYYLKEIIKREKVNISKEEAFLVQSQWLLTTIGDQKIEGGKPFLVFNTQTGTFYGSTGCNSMNGEFQITNELISFSNIRQTKMACSFLQGVEKPFTKILGRENRIKIEFDRIYFYQDRKVVLEFKSNWED